MQKGKFLLGDSDINQVPAKGAVTQRVAHRLAAAGGVNVEDAKRMIDKEGWKVLDVRWAKGSRCPAAAQPP
jgi:ribosomal protein S19E (S16A)